MTLGAPELTNRLSASAKARLTTSLAVAAGRKAGTCPDV